MCVLFIQIKTKSITTYSNSSTMPRCHSCTASYIRNTFYIITKQHTLEHKVTFHGAMTIAHQSPIKVTQIYLSGQCSTAITPLIQGINNERYRNSTTYCSLSNSCYELMLNCYKYSSFLLKSRNLQFYFNNQIKYS